MEIKEIVSSILCEQPEIKSVYFVGCGASRSDLYPAYYFLNNNAKKIRTSIHTANEFNMALPAGVDETSIVITCSLGGNTPESAKATSVAKEHGAHTVAFTNHAGSDITKDADFTYVFKWESTYSSKMDKMIKVMLLACEVLNSIEGYEYRDLMFETAEKILPSLDAIAVQAQGDAKKFAEEYKNSPLLFVMGTGACQEIAWSFSSCLMMEMQWLNASSFNGGDFFHGPFELVDKDVDYLILMNDGSTRPMDERELTFVQRFNAHVTVVDAKDYGIAGLVPKEVIDYFNPVVLSPVLRVYAERLSEAREHPLTKRRYMWKIEY